MSAAPRSGSRTTAIAGLLWLVAARAAPGPAAVQPEILHEPIGCVVAGELPLIEALIGPADSIMDARVYFKVGSRITRYFVEMQQREGKFVGTLPKPTLGDKTVRYSVRAWAIGRIESRTDETVARVVRDEAECPAGTRAAARESAGRAIVFNAATGKSATWPVPKGH